MVMSKDSLDDAGEFRYKTYIVSVIFHIIF